MTIYKKSNLYTWLTYAFISLASVGIISCQKEVQNLHSEQLEVNNPDVLFAAGIKLYIDWAFTSDPSQNIGHLAAQYFTQTTKVTESRYNWQVQPISANTWKALYTAITHWKAAQISLQTQEANPVIRANKVACLELMQILAYQGLVDTFGDIPYSETVEIHPVYQDAAFIYEDMIQRLDNAKRAIDITQTGFGSSDVIYRSDMSKWKKFAN
ncbi:MAG: SusD/RagB family nutrient-binding outer membrane lipoprotein, partial [Bacteroidota bacterium]